MKSFSPILLVAGLSLATLQVSQAQIRNPRDVDASPAETPGVTKKPSPPPAKPKAEPALQSSQPEVMNNDFSTPYSETPIVAVYDESVSLPTPVLNTAAPVVEKMEKGEVNWSRQYIEVKGTGIINQERFKNQAQARAMAQRAAVVDAQRNLLEVSQGVHVNSETTVRDLMLESDVITTRVNGIVKGAEQMGNARLIDGGAAIEVTMRMPLYAKSSLASAVVDGVKDPVNPGYADPRPVENPQARQTQQPDRMDQTGRTATPGNSLVGGNASVGETTKQLAFNMLNGGKLNPELFPVIFDEKGNVAINLKELYDPTKGKFPQIIQGSRQIMQTAGFDKGVQVIDLIQKDGRLVIANTNRNDTWKRVGQVAAKIGKFLLMLL